MKCINKDKISFFYNVSGVGVRIDLSGFEDLSFFTDEVDMNMGEHFRKKVISTIAEIDNKCELSAVRISKEEYFSLTED